MSFATSNLRSGLRAVVGTPGSVPVYTGGGAAAMAYYIFQVVHGTDKEVIVRAIGCAVMAIFKDQGNIFKASDQPSALTGLTGPLQDTNVPNDAVIVTNFKDAMPVTKGEILSIATCESEEIASVVAMYCWTAGKTPNGRNYSAFDAKRMNAVSQRCLGPPRIFGQSTAVLGLDTLMKAAASLTALGGHRAPLFESISDRTVTASILRGPALAFMSLYAMLRDVGLGAIRLIDEGKDRYPQVAGMFPELAPQLAAVQAAKQSIMSFPEPHRSFCKIIHGDLYVPVPPRAISNAFGVYKFLFAADFPSYANYGGGTITPSQLTQLQALVGLAPMTAGSGFQPTTTTGQAGQQTAPGAGTVGGTI